MRFWEIDFLRGFGIILMLISNFITDLQIFLNYPSNQFWDLFAKFTASIFVFVSGVSFYVCYSIRGIKKILIRFVKLMSLGFLITIVTSFLLKEGTIYFGILHFLALAWILAIPLYKVNTIPIAAIFIMLTPLIDSVHAKTLLLLPIGITPPNFYTLDYFPVFPWFGIFLIGLRFGKIFMRSDLKEIGIFKFICLLGRRSLQIYLIHQPIFVSLIVLIFGDSRGILSIPKL